MESIRRAATAGAAFSFISIVAMRVLGFATSLLLARILLPKGLGSYSILLGFNEVLRLVAGLGITIIAPKLVAETARPDGEANSESIEIIRSLLTVTGLLGIIAGMLVALASPILANMMFGTAHQWPMIAIVGASVCAIAWSSAVAGFLQGLHGIRRLAVLNTGVSALFLILSVPAARFFGVAGAFGAMALAHLGLTLAGIASLPRDARRPAWSARTREIMARGMRLGWPLLFSSLALAMVGWIVRAWLGRTYSLAEVGRYQVAETLNQAILFVPLALAIPLYPLASTMAAHSPRDRARTFGPVFGYVALLTLPVSLFVGWGARLWLNFYGVEYHAAWPVVYLLSAGYFLSSLGTITGALLAGFGLTLDSMRLTVIWAVTFLIPALLLAPRFGAYGVAAAQVLSYLIQAIVLSFYFRRRLGIRVLAVPRLLATFVVLFVAGFWILPRVQPLVGALLVVPAAAVVLIAAGDLRRRALAHVTGWIFGRRGDARPVDPARPADAAMAAIAPPRHPARPAGRILVGCYRGMGDLLYVSSIVGQLREETPRDIGIDLAAGAGLWADSVRHLPHVDRVIPVDSWDRIEALGRDGYRRTLVARVSNWMPFSTYRGWTLRARLEGLHLVDVLAHTMRVRLKPEFRRPVYYFDPADPEDDPAEAGSLGRFAVVSVHAFTQSQHNLEAETNLLGPLLDLAARTGHKLVLVGPPAGGPGGTASAVMLPPSVHDRRGAPIRRVATFVERATVVVSVMNGIAVLADALNRPLVLIALGRDPVSVVGPLLSPPIEILGRTGSTGVGAVNVERLVQLVDRELSR